MSAVSHQLSDRELLELLLAEAATQGLSRGQRAELEMLRTQIPVDFGVESLERAATAIDLAFGLDDVPLGASTAEENVAEIPRRLEGRLLELASEFVASTSRHSALDDDEREPAPATLDFARPVGAADPERSGARERRRHGASPAARAGWWFAAAAVLLALVGWWPQIAEDPGLPVRGAPADQTASDLIVVVLEGTSDAAAVGASGTAEWSTETQSGVLRIAGLAVNDPRQAQYQLWIFDRAQDERYPIDGGVFDIPASAASGKTIDIPIDAKIQVSEPTLFAITVERPGGVVVSSRDRIALAGAVA